MCGCRGHGGALPPEPVPRPRGGVWPLQGPLCSLRSQLCVNKDATCSTGGAPCPGSAGECPAPAPLCLLSVCALAPAQSWLHTGNVSGTGPARVPLTVGAGRTCPWSLSVSQGVGQRWWAGPLCIPPSGGLVWAESHPGAGVHSRGRAGWCSQAGDGGGPGGPAGMGQGQRLLPGAAGGVGATPAGVLGWERGARTFGARSRWHGAALGAAGGRGQLLSWECCPPCPAVREEAWLEMHVGPVSTGGAGGAEGAGPGSCCCRWAARSWQGQQVPDRSAGVQREPQSQGSGQRTLVEGAVESPLACVGSGGGRGGAGASRGGGGQEALYRREPGGCQVLADGLGAGPRGPGGRPRG